MNQRDLEFFVKVVDAGSFSQAAILLGRPQPTLSRYIRDLESDLSIALLYRNGRGVVLTDAGRRLYSRAKIILQQIAEARAEVNALAIGGISSAVIGMPPSLCSVLAPPLTRTLCEAYPKVSLRFVEGLNGHLLEWLLDDRFDVALLYEVEATRRMHAEPLISEVLHLVTTTSGEALPAQIQALHLAEFRLILPSRQHGLRQQVELWAMRHGILLDIAMESDAYSSTLNLVRHGVGATLLPQSAIKDTTAMGQLQSALIVAPQLLRQLVIASPPNKPVSLDLLRFIKLQVRGMDATLGWTAG
ncbi:LysR family transcriptional regulator [Hyphomicrobiales bacterium]|nr:LysR family transcriptional regulator [Hyphomicrobiales bacterium]CAH1691313.1 LysR family transcriptional regulator [Hyphomicrobiales bacterium]